MWLEINIFCTPMLQMFVTKNKVLCTQVRKNFQELCRGEPVALHHVDVEKDLLPHRLQVELTVRTLTFKRMDTRPSVPGCFV